MDPIYGSQRLRILAQQLRLYRPPSSSSFSDEDENEESGASGKVVSHADFAESAAPISNPAKFKTKRAAVLICLFEGDAGDLRVILTKRSSNLSTHAGEVSLPGGKVDEGDVDDIHTATREAKEEIGLDPSLVTIVTVLEPFISKYFLKVIPVVGILSDKKAFKPVLNANEVEAIFDAPLEMFLKDENRRSEEREYKGIRYLIHFFDFEAEDGKYLIWGMTAWILIHAASVMYQRPPSFEGQKPPFKIPITRTEGST
ncbi:nudix hydrolase 15, mitochondrial-like [Magnolia sinica]|uniref:nudix hydrolase 15, mitochondrial-like n=1 Tax=Magnolia sinica TaxID=86752 RepID=UPI002658B1AB|nr:nudix hydrolase 15, mitochondrial-like [Magnolia sinica]